MMWQSSSQKIGGYRCVEHKITGEVALVGMKGEVWTYDDKGSYRAILTDHRTANKLFKALGRDSRNFKLGDEALLKFTEAELPRVIKALRVITNLEIARQRANNSLTGKPLV